MNEKDQNANLELDEFDIKMQQMLSEELSDLTVSEELFDRTLRAVKETEKKKQGAKRRRLVRTCSAAAVVVLVIGLSAAALRGQDAKNDSMEEYSSNINSAGDTTMEFAPDVAGEDSAGESTGGTFMGEDDMEVMEGGIEAPSESEQSIDRGASLAQRFEEELREETLTQIEGFTSLAQDDYEIIWYESEEVSYEFHVYAEGYIEAKRTAALESESTFWYLDQ